MILEVTYSLLTPRRWTDVRGVRTKEDSTDKTIAIEVEKYEEFRGEREWQM